MRCAPASSIVLLILAVLLLVLSASAAPGFSKVQSKPRTIRGFKNVVLSTARNFGKRANVDSQGEFVDEATLQQANAPDFQRAAGNRWVTTSRQYVPCQSVENRICCDSLIRLIPCLRPYALRLLQHASFESRIARKGCRISPPL